MLGDFRKGLPNVEKNPQSDSAFPEHVDMESVLSVNTEGSKLKDSIALAIQEERERKQSEYRIITVFVLIFMISVQIFSVLKQHSNEHFSFLHTHHFYVYSSLVILLISLHFFLNRYETHMSKSFRKSRSSVRAPMNLAVEVVDADNE